MNDLKRKIVITLITILSSFLIFLITLYNMGIYNREYSALNEKIMFIDNLKSHLKYNNEKNPAIMDIEAYEIVINNQGNIDEIYSYSSSSLSSNEIKEIINKNIKRINSDKTGLLYTSKYIFNVNRYGNIIMINNTKTKNFLLEQLLKSTLVFIFLEIIIIFLSIKIARWIIKPAIDAFEKQKQFIYDASHELKTPIAIISASAETLEKSPKEKKWLLNIKSETEKMNKLVSSLLELSKTESIKESENFEVVDLSKIIHNKALSFESLLFENNLHLELGIEDNINFNCNKDKIKELLSILIDNAIKHSYKDCPIKINLSKEKTGIILSVINKGDEIPIDEREKIFERFYRVDKSRNRNENRYGLGLSIAKNIVINHGGVIKVTCYDGYTKFIVNFK